jgi:hypothetical protein
VTSGSQSRHDCSAVDALQVIVTDALAPPKWRTAVQAVDFEPWGSEPVNGALALRHRGIQGLDVAAAGIEPVFFPDRLCLAIEALP